MSTRSETSMIVSENTWSVVKQVGSPMLDKYLAARPTITEKLTLPPPSKNAAEVVGDKVKESEEFLSKWEASWEKTG